MEAEKHILNQITQRHFGKHALLIGVSAQRDLLQDMHIPCHSIVSSLPPKNNEHDYIEGDFHDLPIMTGSIDLVVLPHTLEFIDHPRQLLAEACRIIKPEGLIAVTGFNPYSAWGLRKRMAHHRVAPWTGHFSHPNKVKKWLRLADFAIEQHESAMFRPPLTHDYLFEKLHFLETLGHACFPSLGGVYVLLARAKVVPLTPIKMKWKQQLDGIRISTTISGHIARRSK